MKPAPFAYAASTTLDEALDALAQEGAVVLAGGQSLVLELVFRERQPRALVDLNRVAGLDHAREDAAGLTLGALVRHAALEQSGPGPVRRLLARAAPYVAHPPIRARGTFCGSVAWAHPAAEWNAVAVVLAAEIRVRSARGSRTVAARDWFLGDRRTARQPDELVEEVLLPALPEDAGVGFVEHRRTHATFAEVAVAAVAVVRGGVLEHLRLAVAGAADRPVRLDPVEAALVGVAVDEVPGRVRALARAGTSGSDHRAALVAELAGRAVTQAVAA